MKRELKITTHAEQAAEDVLYWRSRTPEERLLELERLRQEAGKFLYDYPFRFQKVVTVTRREQQLND